MQIDADPVPYPACHFDADPDPDFRVFNADPGKKNWRIRIHNTVGSLGSYEKEHFRYLPLKTGM
jgi:hypothetical protein